MLSVPLITLLLLLSTLSVGSATPTPITPTSVQIDHQSERSYAAFQEGVKGPEVYTDSPETNDPRSAVDPIAKRQTTAKDILRRATKRLTAPRAYSSTTPCGGFAGQTVILQTQFGYVGYPTTSVGPAGSLSNALTTTDAAIRFTFNSVCQLATSNGAILNTHSAGPADFLYVDVNVASYSPLTCHGDATNTLTCTRFSTATAGSFCSNGNRAFGFGNNCIGALVVTPILVDA
ncbi:hypothetical protein I316_07430 [Kwoniella heveanensis BCC8398]|uniref:Uncharacterized protein n=1 Tax=Kwoniella heveanensis BCC8398 TaxID=1296120 RepID=A0A1B9GIZ8_9TREE|nr:hypothetical protein I316_07430 [Kwoniella heveanensis BCC8398]